jgi:hypothetical protein
MSRLLGVVVMAIIVAEGVVAGPRAFAAGGAGRAAVYSSAGRLKMDWYYVAPPPPPPN